MGYWGVVNNCLKNADVVLFILDARIPNESANREVLRKAGDMSKDLIFVFNKCDLINAKNLKKLKEKYEDAFFVTIKRRISILAIKKHLDKLAENRDKDQALRVALIGYPNVGKSSVLNILVPETRAKVSSVSGTTKKTQWIRQGNLRFMDTPGVIPKYDSRVRVGLTASKDAHKLKNPDKVAYEVIKVLRKQNPEGFKKTYGISYDDEDSDYDILLQIGEKRKYLIKGGDVDENRTVTQIISDWQKGRIK